MLFWLKTFDMLADHPLGVGLMGYQVLSPQYLPAEWLTGGVRAVHSTWFEVLSSFGYQGFVMFMGYIGSTFLLARRVRKYLREKGEQFHALQLVALEASFVGFLVAATFINRFYGEMLYWLPALIAVFANVYMIKPQREEETAPMPDKVD
jgi:O-antigen ligase